MRVGINGFGRIGRLVFRILLERGMDVEISINDLATPSQIAYAARFDSNYGAPSYDIRLDQDELFVAGKRISLFREKDPQKIEWDVDLVVEATGRYTQQAGALLHMKGRCAKVLVTGPSKDIPMMVLGVNDEELERWPVISNASCTTNCLAPLLKVLDEKIGIEEALMSTIHAVTGSQSLVDGFREDLRDARAASSNVVPSSTGAAKAVGLVYPPLLGKVTGISFRVPVATVSVVDVVVRLQKPVGLKGAFSVLEEASRSNLKGILGYTDDPVVSSDFIGDARSSILDKGASIELNPSFIKLVSWYDNEWGYSNRVVDLIGRCRDIRKSL